MNEVRREAPGKSSEAAGSAPNLRTAWLPAPLIALAAFAYFSVLACKDSLLGINSDAVVYLLLAEHWSPWRDGAVSFADHLVRTYPYPPVYPLVLSVLGGGAGQPVANYLVGAGLLAVAMVVLARWLWKQRVERSILLGMLVVFACAPATIFVAFGVFSEPLYLVLATGGLLALDGERPSRSAWMAAAVLIGAAAVTRSIGVSLIAACLVSWCWHTRLRQHRFVPALLVAPYLAWSAWKRIGDGEPGYLASMPGDGPGATLAAMVAQVPVNLHAMWTYLHRSFDLLGNAYSAVVLAALLLAALVRFRDDLRRYRIAALYVAAYLGVLLVWPYPNHMGRFLFPILPLLIFYAVEGPARLLRGTAYAAHGSTARIVALALLVLVTAPSSVSIWQQIAQYRDTELAHYPKTAQWYGRDSQAESIANIRLTERIFGFMMRAGDYVPADACVTAVMPEFVHLYARRIGVRPAAASESEATLRAGLAACPYVMMFHVTMFPTLGDSQYYPLQRVRDDLVVIFHEPVEPGDEQGQRMLLARYAPARHEP